MTPEDIARLKAAGDPYAFGVLPSKIDTRDYAFKAPRAVQTPPTFTHPSARKVPVRNQQGGTCVGNSIATCLSLMEYAENKQVIPFNGELLNGRVVSKQYGEGAAASPHDVLDDIVNHGAAAFMGDGGVALYFPKAYAAVDHTNAQAVREALSTPGTTVSASCWLLQGFGDNEATVYQPDNPGENPWGYHQLTFIGYDDKGVLFQNSWGTGWGDGGFGRFAWNYVTSGRVGECWAITDNPDNAGGRVNEWTAPTEANTGRAVRKGTSAAVYLLESGGRIWIQSLAQAKQMGVDMSRVQSLPPTDMAWNTPVIGPDAPLQYQG